jgi:hypothetical protein
MSRFHLTLAAAGEIIVRTAFLISILALALGALAPASAEDQSWSKRAPPPVKFAPPPSEQKPQDWSGVYVGVNGGTALSRGGRGSGVPAGSGLPR